MVFIFSCKNIVKTRGVYGVDGYGWQNVQKKQNFKDSVNFIKLPKVAGEDLVSSLNTSNAEDEVLILIGDTTVTLALGRIVYKSSNNHFYGCVRTNSTGSGTRWKQLDN